MALKRKHIAPAPAPTPAPLARINPALEPLAVDIATLRPDPHNARKHGTRNLAAIKASLNAHGQQKPVVVSPDGTTMAAGSGLLLAAQELGWERLAVVVYDGETRSCRAYGIADNRSAELAEWQVDVLLEDVADLGADFDLSFTEADLAALQAEVVEEEDRPHSADSIRVTAEERETIDRAMAKAREMAGDPGMAEGRALELICADWLAGK